MRQLEPVTIDQLIVFLAVADAGSFSAAARALHRGQSAVSYAIGNIERLLEVKLFERTGRRPTLTKAGRELLAEARAVVERMERLQLRAGRMAEGVEPQLGVAVDMLFGMQALITVVREFQQRWPDTALRLHTEALGSVAQLVRDGVCDLGLSAVLHPFPAGLEHSAAVAVPVLAVAAPGHPLAGLPAPLSSEALGQHVQMHADDADRVVGRGRVH